MGILKPSTGARIAELAQQPEPGTLPGQPRVGPAKASRRLSAHPEALIDPAQPLPPDLLPGAGNGPPGTPGQSSTGQLAGSARISESTQRT